MAGRDFSDTVKFETIKANLAKHSGEIRCEICKSKLLSITECHFDHIHPYAKGGKSIASNCQILCVDCNLKKNDKELKDFILEEKARSFLLGETLDIDETQSSEEAHPSTPDAMTKDIFDRIIHDFISRKGDIHKVDFGREYNHLPSIHYVRQYYGNLNNLKKAFGIEDLSFSWNRETITTALVEFVRINGCIAQKDLTKANKLPSLPCILSYFPEYKNFTDIKRGICNIDVPEHWTVENAIQAGKSFASKHGRITQKDLYSVNHLPTSNVINRLFGSLANYQALVGTEVSKRNEFVSKEEISRAVETFFQGNDRVIESQRLFFETFPYSPSTILKRYGTFSDFCKEQGIQVLNSRKAKYTKREVDDAISKWIKAGKEIPVAKDLAASGLPSTSVILKFYADWKEPFYLYMKMYEEMNRH